MSFLEEFRSLRDTREERQRQDPAAFHRPFAYQEPFHSSSAKERWFVAGNRSGKTLSGAYEVVRLITGQVDWWHGPPGEVWCGAVSLADSAGVQRKAIRKLIPPALVKRWARETDPASESTLETTDGWIVRFKAYAQGRERWQGGEVALVWFDEEPPGDLFDEGFTRTVSCAGRIIVTFTPLNGLSWVEAYDRVYRPWIEYQRSRPGAKHGLIAPGIHVTTGSMAENPTIPASEVAALRQRYAHRPLVLRVRVDGEWLDISDDAIVPVEQFKTWTDEPVGGWRELVAWIDPAYSKHDHSDRACISVAGLGHDDGRYLLAQVFGRWDAAERVRRCAQVLDAYGHPPCYVQRVTPDMEFRERFNEYLMRSGRHPVCRIWREKERVLGKVERAESFAVLVGAGKVHVRPEHEEFRHEAAVFPHGPHDDVLDSGMGALMALGGVLANEAWIEAVKLGGLGGRGGGDTKEDSHAWDDEHESRSDQAGWDGDLSPEGWAD